MANTKKAAEILRRAVELMNNQGAHWTQGDYSDQDPATGEARYCSLGAIYRIGDEILDKYSEEYPDEYDDTIDEAAERLEGKVKSKEELAMEVLAARARLGESIWTFRARHEKTLRSLEQQGLVFVMPGIVDHTVRAGLTDSGKARVLSDNYVPPTERRTE